MLTIIVRIRVYKKKKKKYIIIYLQLFLLKLSLNLSGKTIEEKKYNYVEHNNNYRSFYDSPNDTELIIQCIISKYFK